MRRPDGVDVVLLHEDQVSLQKLERDSPSVVGVMFVSIDASQLDRLSVDGEDTVYELSPAEADPLCQSAAGRREHQLVEIGSLGGPFVRLLDGDLKDNRTLP